MPNRPSVIVVLDADDLACVEADCPEALSGEVVAFQTEMHLILEERGIRHSTPWTFVSRKDRPELEALEADIWRHWTRHARIEFEGINLLDMAAFRHVAAFARLAWAGFSIRRALERCQPARVYAFDEPPAHGLDQPPGCLKMPLLSGVLRGLAKQAALEVRLISRSGPDGAEGFVDQVAERGRRTHVPVETDTALRGQPFVLFNGNGAELIRQLPLIHEIQQGTGHQVVQLYKDADANHLEQLQQSGHLVWHESQVLDPGPLPDIERTARSARETFETASRRTTDELGVVFHNPHVACHFDFLFGEYARKMASHVRAWKHFFARHRPAAFVANYHAPIYDVAAAVGIPCLGLPHGSMTQGLSRWFSTLPRRSLVGALSERHRRTLVAAGMAPERLRLTGNPCSDLNHRAGINETPEPQASACANRSERGSPNIPHRHRTAAPSSRQAIEDGSPEDLRRQFNLAPNRRIILLCTTSLGMPSHLPHLPLVDWAEAVRDTYDLARLAERHEDWVFLIKQHPRYDHPALYAAVNRTLPPERQFILLPGGPLVPWAAAADLVCIWNSVTSATVQASFSGTPVVLFSKAMIWYDAEAWGCEAWPHFNDLQQLEAEWERLLDDPSHHEERVRQTRRAALGFLAATADTSVNRCMAVVKELLHPQIDPALALGARNAVAQSQRDSCLTACGDAET